MTDTTTPPPPSPAAQGNGGILGGLFGGLPFFGGGQNGQGFNPMGLLQGIFGGLGQGNKNKGAAQDPNHGLPSTEHVPTASGGFYQQSDPGTRAAMLKAMMDRARLGAQPPVSAMPPPAVGG